MRKIIYISAEFCGQCHVVLPKVREYCTDNGIELTVLDAEEDNIDSYNVRNIPVIIFYKDGEEISRGVGMDGWNNVRQAMEDQV